MIKMNKQKILQLLLSWSWYLFSIWIRQATCNQVTISDYLDLSKKIPFFHSRVWQICILYNANVLHYFVNIIVVNGLVELVVEIIQELDSLSGSTANKVALIFWKTPPKWIKSFSHKKLVKVSIYLWAVSLVKPTISPKKRVVFSYILHITCNVLTR